MLDKLRVVITGAAGSLGQAAAEKARASGAYVIGLDIVDTQSLANTDEYHQVNLMDRDATRECFAALGDIDALCNIAGGFAMGDTAYDADSDQWAKMFAINVDTMRNATMAAVPLLKQKAKGAIVNIGAIGALSGIGTMSAYCCSKGSVMKLTESLSDELREDGINVNAVMPSIIDTPPNREGMPDADFSKWVSPQQLAEVICFLASPAASGVHGALVPVRGLS
ncbi:SDR family oxidoreductase [Mangrovimicrobium sediminis]|uniref:SDR family oxidoreductase n=1 Tax=Mangrovimicrobium sediminis TaxID=2562682 RepID=A0A4Z0LVR9_9GAMM|nr:SDR family NAD(P)-dependent oxidoreductase [Haliea sp. SAOS-164]TGD71381.1 SDR family oxidoreductase [Haliea sp. SAOS-164]